MSGKGGKGGKGAGGAGRKGAGGAAAAADAPPDPGTRTRKRKSRNGNETTPEAQKIQVATSKGNKAVPIKQNQAEPGGAAAAASGRGAAALVRGAAALVRGAAASGQGRRGSGSESENENENENGMQGAAAAPVAVPVIPMEIVAALPAPAAPAAPVIPMEIVAALPAAAPAAAGAEDTYEMLSKKLFHNDIKKDHGPDYDRGIVNSICAKEDILTEYVGTDNFRTFFNKVIEGKDYEDFRVNDAINSSGQVFIKHGIPGTNFYEYDYLILNNPRKKCNENGAEQEAIGNAVSDFYGNDNKLLFQIDTGIHPKELVHFVDNAIYIYTRESEIDPASRPRAVDEDGCVITTKYFIEDPVQNVKVLHYPKYTNVNEKQTHFFSNYDIFVDINGYFTINNRIFYDNLNVIMTYKRQNNSIVKIIDLMNTAGGFRKLTDAIKKAAGIKTAREAKEAVFISKLFGDVGQAMAYLFPRYLTPYKKAVGIAEELNNDGMNADDIYTGDAQYIHILETIDKDCALKAFLLGRDAIIMHFLEDRMVLFKKRGIGMNTEQKIEYYNTKLVAKKPELNALYASLTEKRDTIIELTATFNTLLNTFLTTTADEKINEAQQNIENRALVDSIYKEYIKKLVIFAYHSTSVPKEFPEVLTPEEIAIIQPQDDQNQAVILERQDGESDINYLNRLVELETTFAQIETKLKKYPLEFIRIANDQIFNDDKLDIKEITFGNDFLQKEIGHIYNTKKGKFYDYLSLTSANTAEEVKDKRESQKLYIFEKLGINYLYVAQSMLKRYNDQNGEVVLDVLKRFTKIFGNDSNCFKNYTYLSNKNFGQVVTEPLENIVEGGGMIFSKPSITKSPILDIVQYYIDLYKLVKTNPSFFISTDETNTTKDEEEETGIFATSAQFMYITDLMVDVIANPSMYATPDFTIKEVEKLIQDYKDFMAEKEDKEEEILEGKIPSTLSTSMMHRQSWIPEWFGRTGFTRKNARPPPTTPYSNGESSPLPAPLALPPAIAAHGGSRRKTRRRHVTKKKSSKSKRRQTRRQR